MWAHWSVGGRHINWCYADAPTWHVDLNVGTLVMWLWHTRSHTRSHRVSRHMCAHKWTHNPASICGHIGVYAQTSMYGHISVPRVCVCVYYIYISAQPDSTHIAGCIGTTYIDDMHTHTHTVHWSTWRRCYICRHSMDATLMHAHMPSLIHWHTDATLTCIAQNPWAHEYSFDATHTHWHIMGMGSLTDP